jgi:hypothetical protein
MKTFYTLAVLLTLFCQPTFSQKIPEGYILQYQQLFNNNKSLSDFQLKPPASWGIFNIDGNSYLQCAHTSPFTIPANNAIISNKIFGDFILEADLMPVPDSSGYRESCLFLGMRDSTRYYYIRLASQSDPGNHGIYLVRNSLVTRLTGISEQPMKWKENKWHKIRLERDIVKRTIVIYVDDMKHPALQIKDYELIMGMVGIGTSFSSGRFDNIRIWAPTVISNE